MSDQEYTDAHKQIEQLDIDKDAKNELHESLKEVKDNPTMFEELKKHIQSFFKPETSKPKEKLTSTDKKISKVDIDLNDKEMPEKCYFEINCEGKTLSVQLPEKRTIKPIRIRPKGKGSLVIRLSQEKQPIHKIDRTARGYKFTDFSWINSRQMWLATDKLDPN